MTNAHYDSPADILKDIKDAYKRSGLTLTDVHKDTELPYLWLRSFFQDRYKNPSINRVMHLALYFQERGDL